MILNGATEDATPQLFLSRDVFEKDLLAAMNARGDDEADAVEEAKSEEEEEPDKDYIQVLDQSEHLFISYA